MIDLFMTKYIKFSISITKPVVFSLICWLYVEQYVVVVVVVYSYRSSVGFRSPLMQCNIIAVII